MNARTLQAAIAEAERFLDLARKLQPEFAKGFYNGSRLIPADVLADVEAWLRGRPVGEVQDTTTTEAT